MQRTFWFLILWSYTLCISISIDDIIKWKLTSIICTIYEWQSVSFFARMWVLEIPRAVVNKQNTDIFTARVLSSARCDEASHQTNQGFKSTNTSDNCDSRLLRTPALHCRRFRSPIVRPLAQSTECAFPARRLRPASQTEACQRTKTRWRRTDIVQEDLVWCRQRDGICIGQAHNDGRTGHIHWRREIYWVDGRLWSVPATTGLSH